MITGTVKAVRMKDHRLPGFKSVGLLVDETWYNTVTKFPDKIQRGHSVSFELYGDADTLIDGKTLKVHKDGESVPSQVSHAASLETLQALSDHCKLAFEKDRVRLDALESQLKAITDTLGVSSKGSTTKSKKSSLEPLIDDLNDGDEPF